MSTFINIKLPLLWSFSFLLLGGSISTRLLMKLFFQLSSSLCCGKDKLKTRKTYMIRLYIERVKHTMTFKLTMSTYVQIFKTRLFMCISRWVCLRYTYEKGKFIIQTLCPPPNPSHTHRYTCTPWFLW